GRVAIAGPLTGAAESSRSSPRPWPRLRPRGGRAGAGRARSWTSQSASGRSPTSAAPRAGRPLTGDSRIMDIDIVGVTPEGRARSRSWRGRSGGAPAAGRPPLADALGLLLGGALTALGGRGRPAWRSGSGREGLLASRVLSDEGYNVPDNWAPAKPRITMN